MQPFKFYIDHSETPFFRTTKKMQLTYMINKHSVHVTQWIVGPTEWPVRSPILNYLNFLWRHRKYVCCVCYTVNVSLNFLKIP